MLTLLVLAVAFAALSDWRTTFEVVGLAGQRVWGALASELRAGIAQGG